MLGFSDRTRSGIKNDYVHLIPLVRKCGCIYD